MIDLKILHELTQDLTLMFSEDDDNARALFERVFKRLFKEVHVFPDGKEAYEFYEKNLHSIDVVITDITMPKMTGIELSERIKELNPEQKIIILSAHDENDRLFKLINIGVDGFLVKPPEQEQMNKTIFKVCTVIHDQKELKTAYMKLKANAKVMERQLENNARLLNAQQKVAEEEKQQTIQGKQPVAPQTSISVPTINTTTEVHHVHTNATTEYLVDDVVELREIIDDVDYQVIKIFSTSEITEEKILDIEKLAKHYAKYSFILKSYPSFTFLSEKLFELSCILRDLQNPEIQHHIPLIGEFLECMTYSLLMFQKQVMEEQKLNPNFYDASLANDIDTIINIVTQKEEASSGGDLIDFF